MKWFDEENKSFWDKWHRDQDKNRPDYRFEVPPPVPGPPKRGKTSAEKEIARLEDLGDRNWSRPQDLTMKQLGLSSESEEGKRTEKAITAPSRETEAEKEARHKIINGLREERIQQIKDEERWKKLRLHGEENLRSNPSYSKDEERNVLMSALGLEKDYNKALNDALTKSRKDGKLVDNETLKKLLDLEKKAKTYKEAFLSGKFDLKYPSSTVTRTVNGDKEYAERFRGMADELLYTVKNKKALDGLDSSWGQRKYSDGTVTRVTSLIRQDYVEIDVSKSTLILEGYTCSITLINVPSIVQPMRYPGVIGRGQTILTGGGLHAILPVEVEGTDYIKTYYEFSSKCQLCNPLAFSICETAKLSSEPTEFLGTLSCLPYSFPDITVPVNPDSANNHCIYSFWGCQAEIIEKGIDDGGDFFLWKAYTEYSRFFQLSNYEISRTGLGYLSLRGFQSLPSGKEVCSSNKYTVRVDCCHKATDIRRVDLWWERTVNCAWMSYKDTVICKVPDEVIGYYELIRYCELHGGALFVLPEYHGGCIPFTWTLEGPGTIGSRIPYGEIGGYHPDPYRYTLPKCVPVKITVKDRCGTADTIVADCCKTQELGILTINATSMTMTFNQQQNLQASGGCPPYSWSTTAGIIVVQDFRVGPNDLVTFTAPNSNVDCINNPIVTLTDCCGASTSMTFYVSSGSSDAAVVTKAQTVTSCACIDYYGGICISWLYSSSVETINYDCAGNILSDVVSYQNNLMCNPGLGHCPNCCPNGSGCYTQSFNGTTDLRSVDMKAAGCCPINPFTGLPFF